MREKYVRRRKNRTRTMRILENLRRPTVIVESLSESQSDILNEVVSAWDMATSTESIQKEIETLLSRIKPTHLGKDKRMVEVFKLCTFSQIKLQMLVRSGYSMRYFFFCELKLHFFWRKLACLFRLKKN